MFILIPERRWNFISVWDFDIFIWTLQWNTCYFLNKRKQWNEYYIQKWNKAGCYSEAIESQLRKFTNGFSRIENKKRDINNNYLLEHWYLMNEAKIMKRVYKLERRARRYENNSPNANEISFFKRHEAIYELKYMQTGKGLKWNFTTFHYQEIQRLPDVLSEEI